MLTNAPEVRKDLTRPRLRFFPQLRSGFGAALLVLALLGITLRLTIRDQFWPVAFVYYGTPPAVLAGLWLTAAACLDWRLRRRTAVLALALGGMCAAWSYQTMWFEGTPRTQPEYTRIVMWNAARGTFGWGPVIDQARSFDADILCLAEAGRATIQQRQLWDKALQDYEHSYLWHGTMIFSRGRIETLQLGRTGRDIAYQVCRVETEQGPLVVALIDICSDPLNWRRAAFTELMQVLAPYEGQPLVLLGDFNTPPDSIWFDPIRAAMRSAFETVGEGYAATWPHPLPVLTLDQVWLSPQVDVLNCRTIGGWMSDHRAVVTEISFPQAVTRAF